MDLMRSLPLGLYLETPITWLHQLDSRVAFGMLTSFCGAITATVEWRLGTAAGLIVLTQYRNSTGYGDNKWAGLDYHSMFVV
jgi:energy-coupling factor transport system permease protein